MSTEGQVAVAPQQSMRKEIESILRYVNKPSRYIGCEQGSIKKDWDNSSAKICLAFPDLYEIGISNLGHRILYHVINNSASNFLADRVYAPDKDFRDLLGENKLPLYGVESFKPLNEFDAVAFSLQYELSYPTLLSMLEFSDIAIRSTDRDDKSPIIAAGGPGSYNPEPLREFIDVFFIGDGEEILVEFMESVKKAKAQNLSRKQTLKLIAEIDGAYVPSLYSYKNGENIPTPIEAGLNKEITRRFVQFDSANFPVNFPIPSCLAVHDRAVVEIRRGCGRMCRFCQSCFVNLPVRERAPEKVVELTDKVLKNTGYDEYSLLSLSSSDYRNIETLVKTLNERYEGSETSLSLPSQRADAFSVNLANMVQSVRKSTLTFAPEAGSQRMRDVINKNLQEEEIIKAVLSAYEAGWSNVKLYFMIGLPTETFEDLDAMVELLNSIKNKAKALKHEKNINKFIELTCTVSIFVPKTFTPFQWVGQDSHETINEKIRYLKDKMRNIKGVKLNFHEPFLSLLEAVFSRGDHRLNDLIELVYKKGSYLDAWSENFNKKIWLSAAEELNIDFHQYATKAFNTDEVLTWDFIKTGVSKDWLISEYNKSLNSENNVPCDKECTNCGVCSNFDTSCELNSNEDFEILKTIEKLEKNIPDESNEIYKYRLKVEKKSDYKYLSHLDWNRAIYRACKIADLPLHFTNGFNPSPKISIALALPLFVESKGEIVEMELKKYIEPTKLQEVLNKELPNYSKVVSIVEIDKKSQTVEVEIEYAKYSAIIFDTQKAEKVDLKEAVLNMLQKDKIEVEKFSHKKNKTKVIDIRQFIIELSYDEASSTLNFILKAGQNGNLRPDDFLEYLTPGIKWTTTREVILNKDFKEL
ncbi:MAG: TIGR03960 family B12-binding radical SAM protein [bacterium]